MATVQSEVYDAFRSLNIADDLAMNAAIVLARRDNDVSELAAAMRAEFAAIRGEMKGEFAAIRSETKGEFAAIRGETKVEFAAIRGEITLTRWIGTTVLGLCLTILAKLFIH